MDSCVVTAQEWQLASYAIASESAQRCDRCDSKKHMDDESCDLAAMSWLGNGLEWRQYSTLVAHWWLFKGHENNVVRD